MLEKNGCSEKKNDRWKHILRKWGSTIAAAAVFSLILNLGAAAAHRIILQQGIAKEVLRFHILANSDGDEDQKIKLAVRNRVLAWISENGGDISDREEMESFLEKHLTGLEKTADGVLESYGVPYRSSAAMETCYFPERTYGECTFPAGWYKALRICLGEAQGKNWWCVLYPKLCFSDCLCGKTDEKEMQQLEEVLTVEEYESLLHHPDQWTIAFRWF